MKHIFPGIAACLFPLVCAAQEKSIEDWAKELGSEDPAIRRKAEGANVPPLEVLEQLAKHPDPWVAARAERLRMERRGIDTRIPRRLQLAVLDFGKLDEARRNEVLQELANSGPGHLNALAFIHARETDGKIPSEAEADIWRQRFRFCINTNLEEARGLLLEPLSPATRALLLTCYPRQTPEENLAFYAKWRALDPAVRFHLAGIHVVLEIDYLKRHASTADLLEYLPLILDPAARLEAARLVSEAVAADNAFKPEILSETAAIGHLLMLVREGGIQKAQPWYAKHLTAHPGITAKLPATLNPLEVDRLLKAGALSPAIGLFVKFFPEAESPPGFDGSKVEAIVAKLGTKPESLPEGLPAIGDERSLPRMAGFLVGFFPMTRPSPGYSDIDAKVECFDRWAKTDEWLEAARRHGPHPLYHLVMARRGKMADAMLAHEFEREAEALKNLGSLILLRPAIAKDIPARRCSESTLRGILDGGFVSLNLSSPVPDPLLDLAAEWSGFYPDLLAPDSFPTQPLYLAALAWRKGETEKAAAALLACTKPVPIESMNGVKPVPSHHANPLASAAIALLANLLAEKPDADFNLLLPPEDTTRETLQTMLDRLVRMEKRTPGQVRAAMSLSQLLRERFGVNDAKPLFSSHEARSFALDAWMAGDQKLAGDFLIQAYLTDPDKEEHYDNVFAPALRLLGRAEETLSLLEGEGNPLPDSAKASKRARLLRELGRTKEAMAAVSPDHHPELRLRLAIETEEWEIAIRETLDVEGDNTKKREAMQACIALLSGKPELTGRHTAGKHAVLNLLKGNAIREKDLAEMARDTELLARLESRLTAALASGEPIVGMDMSAYFHFLDLLPDRNRAVLLAVELAKRDTCVFSSPSSGEKLTGHKVLAAETLLLLGRGELAFAAMRSLMEASVEPHDFKGVESGAVSGGWIRIVSAGYRQFTRLAHFEWAEGTAAERMDRLGVVLENKDPLARAQAMIALISKHEAKLAKQDLLEALHLVFIDLTHAAEVPDDLKETARALLRKHNPDEGNTRWLESQWTRVPWTQETRHRPSQGKTATKVTFTPKPGAASDPGKPGFVLIDGLAAATKLHQQSDAGGARDLLRNITLRLLLDYDLNRQEVEWRVETQSPSSSFSSGFDTNGMETVLGYFDTLGVPADLVTGLTDACANPWTNYSDAERLLHAARIMARAGDLKASLAYHRRFLIATVPAIGSEDVGTSGRDEIAEMHRIRGLIAAQKGETAAAVEAVRQLVQIAPYVPENARDITAILKEKGNAEATESARAAVEGFWRIRLLEIPTSETYRHWQKEWQSLFP